MKFLDPEEVLERKEELESQPADDAVDAAEAVEAEVEEAKADMPKADEAQIRALALAYARYLNDNNLAPGEPTFAEPDAEMLEEIDELLAEPEAAPEAEAEAVWDLPEFDEIEVPEVEEPEAEEEAVETVEPELEETEAEVPELEVPEAEVEEPEPVEPEVEEAAEAEDEPEAESEESEPEIEEEISEVEELGSEIEEEIPEIIEEAAESDEPVAGKAAEAEEPVAEEPAPAAEPKAKKKTSKQKAAEAAKRKALEKWLRKRNKRKEKDKRKFLKGSRIPLAGVTNLHDKVQDGIDGAFIGMGRGVVRGVHNMSTSYRNTRRGIGVAILVTGLLAAAVLIIFDRFTIYEYAYNGKVLGYVNSQEEVTDVLDVAARNLNRNSSAVAEVEFVANQNVTFNTVDSRGKSADDSDTVVNKLIYMTDIETEAYAVYDGDDVVAIVKDQNDADSLLLQTKDELSQPDKGMTLVSSDFVNELSVKPINVLLGSVQSNAAAQEQMINGGEMHTYHITEEGETVESLASLFGVEAIDVYNEDNSQPVTEIEPGDRVCIRNIVEPVSVEMVEEGRLKEVIEYETIKKETDEYYKGDTVLEQEGRDGRQIFEGTITKVSGVETERHATKKPEILVEKKDKIILVGTAERPKTAATGTFIMPINNYVVTSEMGGRWGRMHEGMDFGAPTGTPIYASDGGKIIKANYWSGHGLCVEIDHGNGVITRYSHCSAVMVSIGDLVYQGQHIANVGNTGHSFGSHLHFEVRVNDVPQNPRNYVNP